MSSRALRRLQKEQELQRQVEAARKAQEEPEDEDEDGDQEEDLASLATPSRPRNVFDQLEQLDDEDTDGSDEEEDRETTTLETMSRPQPPSAAKSKKKKKKKKAKQEKAAEQTAAAEDQPESEDEVDRALKALAEQKGKAAASSSEHLPRNDRAVRASKLLAVEPHHLDPVNEMKSLFGKIALEGQGTRNAPRPRRQLQQGGVDLGTALTGRYCLASRGKELGALANRRNALVKGREEWPLATSGGLSMEAIKDNQELESAGEHGFNILHSKDYREVTGHFGMAVQSMDPQRMISLLQLYPYHVATLIQVAEIAKHQGDHAVAADLLERALYTIGKSASSGFPAALRSGTARVPFKLGSNRDLYLAVFRHIQGLEQRGTWRTVFEWAKLLLQFNPLTDPYGVTLMIDQCALRARQYDQLIALCSPDAYGKAWDYLPNVQISLALAYLRSGKGKEARTQLAVAMHKYPYILSKLASALDISPVPKSLWGKLPSSDAEKLHTELYVTRAKDLWNTPESISLLGEVAETLSHYGAAIKAATPATRLEISLEEARYIMLLEIRPLTALLPRKYTQMLTSSNDPLPPPDDDSLVARAPGTAAMNNFFGAAGAAAEGGPGNILTRIMNWLQRPANTDAARRQIEDNEGQNAFNELQQQLGGDMPEELINHLVNLHITDQPPDEDQQDLGEGVTATGLGMAGGWDYYEEADANNSTDDGSSMPDLESIPDENAPLVPVTESERPLHAAMVEDAEDDEEAQALQQQPAPSGQAVLRRVDSDDELQPSNSITTPTPAAAAPAPQAVPDAPPSASSPQIRHVPECTLLPKDLEDAQRLQRWLLASGLTELQAKPNDAATFNVYIERLKMLPARQRNWVVRMVGQRCGKELEGRVSNAVG